jgi:transcriptional regulator with XRE-family HTH domain/ribosomal protein S18 acetylase RimI-like enzyme
MPTPTPATNPAAVSATIRRLRRERGLTQEALAQAVGVSPQAISKWETGQTMPDITLLLPLSKELGIGVNELLGGNRRQELKEKYDQARDRFGEAYSLMVALEALEEFPDDEFFLYQRAWDELIIGQSGSLRAHMYIERAIDGFTALCRKYPNDHVYRSMLVEAYLTRGAVGDRDQAYAVALAYNGPGRNKEFLMEVFLDEEARMTKKQKATKKALQHLFMRLADHGTPEAIGAAHALLDTLLGDEQILHGLALGELSVSEAKLCLDAEDETGFIHHLTKAYEYARTVDALPQEEIPFQSPLFDRLRFDHAVRSKEENETYLFLKLHHDLLAHSAAEGLKRRMVDELIRCRTLHYDARSYLNFCEKQIGSPYYFNFSTAWDTTREETAAMEASLRYTHASLYSGIEWRVRNGELAERLVSEGTLTGVFAGYLDIILAFCNCKEKSEYKCLPIPEEERAIPTAPEGAKILAIAELLVSHNFRNCGLEEKLLDFVLTGAKKQGYTHAEVYTMEDRLPKLCEEQLAFYERMGFAVIREVMVKRGYPDEENHKADAAEYEYERRYILQKVL